MQLIKAVFKAIKCKSRAKTGSQININMLLRRKETIAKDLVMMRATLLAVMWVANQVPSMPWAQRVSSSNKYSSK